MLLRVVLFLGVLLVLAAGGAFGWQYWQSLPQQSAAAAPEAAPAPGPALEVTVAPPASGLVLPEQDWLISPGGGLVPRDQARVYLRQDKFVKERRALVDFRAPLADLLAEGEALPDEIYQPAFAAIRAPAFARDLCQPLVASFAEGCTLLSAELVDNSYDPVTQSAAFRLHLLFTVETGAVPLPDLGAHVLRDGTVRPPDEAVLAAGSTRDRLALAGAAAQSHCAAIPSCRVSGLYVGKGHNGEPTVRVDYNYLDPLPKGMVAAPPLF